jgi:hypothetical protein
MFWVDLMHTRRVWHTSTIAAGCRQYSSRKTKEVLFAANLVSFVLIKMATAAGPHLTPANLAGAAPVGALEARSKCTQLTNVSTGSYSL